jgi:isoleucyl-tRNA synthetase
MFKPVSPKLDVTALEEGVLQFWKDRKIFEKTGTQRKGAPEYVFYEGPPTANGKPGVHHVEARAFKDMFPRYKIMKGFLV